MQMIITETVGYTRPDGVFDTRQETRTVETTDHTPATALHTGDLVSVFKGERWATLAVSSVHPTCAFLGVGGSAWPLTALYHPLAHEVVAYEAEQAGIVAGRVRNAQFVATLDACERQADDEEVSPVRETTPHTGDPTMPTTDRPTYQILTVRHGQGTPNGYQVQVERGDGVYHDVADGLFSTLAAAERRISIERAKASSQQA